MKFQTWVRSGVTLAAVGALWACATPGPAVAPEPDRGLLSVSDQVDIPAMIAQLPQRLTAAEAERLLVPAERANIQDPGLTYSVQHKTGKRHRHRARTRGFNYGYSPGFGGLFNRFSYYPYGGYYFPYYSAGGYYYPYFFADRAYNPFFYGPGNNWIPAYWAQ